MKRHLTCCLFCFIMLAWQNISAQEVEKLRIDPSQAYGGKVSEYFEQLNYIPLETTKESLFGDIGQLEITDSSFVISDYDTRSVLFFTPKGRYITKIKFKENAYPSLSYEKTNNRIALSVYDAVQKKSTTKYYSVTGKELTGKGSIASQIRTDLISLGNGFAAGAGSNYFAPGMKPVDSISYLLKIYKNDSVYKSFFPYNQIEKPAACAFAWMSVTPSLQEGVVYVSPPLDGGIYKVTRDTAIKIYQMVFPMNRSIPKHIAETKDIKLIDSLRNANWPGAGIITGISHIFLHKDLLFFKTDVRVISWGRGSEVTNQYNFIYNTKTGRLVSIERMIPDEQNGFLPFTSQRINWSGLKQYEGFFYTHISSLELIKAKETNADKNPIYPAVMKHFFETESTKANPVIVQLKLKEN